MVDDDLRVAGKPVGERELQRSFAEHDVVRRTLAFGGGLFGLLRSFRGRLFFAAQTLRLGALHQVQRDAAGQLLTAIVDRSFASGGVSVPTYFQVAGELF